MPTEAACTDANCSWSPSSPACVGTPGTGLCANISDEATCLVTPGCSAAGSCGGDAYFCGMPACDTGCDRACVDACTGLAPTQCFATPGCVRTGSCVSKGGAIDCTPLDPNSCVNNSAVCRWVPRCQQEVAVPCGATVAGACPRGCVDGCSGYPAPCAGRADRAACEAGGACAWSFASCAGTASACTSVPVPTCGQVGCSVYTGTCVGPASCDLDALGACPATCQCVP